MSEDEKPPGLTVVFPAPRALAEAVVADRDQRAAEVLRALQRARGTVARINEPGSSTTPDKAIAGLQSDVRALKEGLSQMTLLAEETARRLASITQVLERSVVVPSEKLADLQRTHDGAVRDLRDVVQGLHKQRDLLAAWRGWWTKQMAVWGVVLAFLLAAEVAFAWRAHSLAQDTHEVLLQILGNQTKAQGGKGTKR